MLIVVSPAKALDYSSALPTRKHSQPRMLDHAEPLVEAMRRKSPEEISALMGISAELAELNFERYADWEAPFTPGDARPALLAFAGDVYQGMDAAATFTERDYTHAQKILRILSGLYGVLRPLDLMQPYRLEMGSKLATERGDDLYDYWGERITAVLNEDLAESPGPAAVVNLASQEYFRSVDPGRLEGRLVTPAFLDSSVGKDPKMISFFAKRARGAMAGWIIRNRVKSLRGLNGFDGLGYGFDAERSASDRPVFVRYN
ncbi:MAG: peroxide stress protein YaaA [Acidimicrobiaceae bacterium]|nr:peroxide stress protein YaaA [Acidimicrobiaceae bacterium]MCY4281006.1 peroxide stress protein YaaA [Acidimicrobiaceae bacterium]